jgi:hypothetical protein
MMTPGAARTGRRQRHCVEPLDFCNSFINFARIHTGGRRRFVEIDAVPAVSDAFGGQPLFWRQDY